MLATAQAANTVADAPSTPSSPTVADALRQFVPDYLAKYQHRMPPQHRKVLGLLIRCRTGGLGNLIYRCQGCQSKHWVGRSCSNRHCPNCQVEKTQQWLAKQTDKLLPVQHFVVTFTVPEELRPLLRANPEVGYEAIFDAGAETIRQLLGKPKNLGSDKLGFFGVLHTWGRDLKDYHPHVHFVVPGGGVAPDGSTWLQVKRDRLFHFQPAKMEYKKQFVEQIRKAGLYQQLPYGVLKFNWVVNIKPVGSGQAVLKYLAPYVYRVAITNSRIVAVTEDEVVYKVKPSGNRQFRTRRLSGERFVRAFAQHILPPGFKKVRYYGFMSSNNKVQLEDVRWLIWLWLGWTFWLGSGRFQPQSRKRKVPQCDRCGDQLELIEMTNADDKLIWSKSQTRRGPPCD